MSVIVRRLILSIYFFIMEFSRPPIYPFWLWNGQQSESEIARQLELMNRRGLPGAAIHARTGNRVPYLSERWMALFRFACQKADELGMKIWIYDELGFPSGTANGAVPAAGEAYQQKSLHFEVHPATARGALKKQKDVLGIFKKNDQEVLVFRRHILPQFSDFLNKKTAPLFLKLVHEKYYAALKEYFGKTIQAVFTDDNLFLLERGAVLPYTDDLEASFKAAYGYSLLENLDALVENRSDSAKIRLDYYRHVALRLNDGFIRPMQEWCTAHHLKFYGHLSSDEGPLDYCARSFGDPGQYMMTLNVPGADDFLTMYHDRAYMRSPRNHFKSIDNLNGTAGFSAIEVMKQASSVASQLGDGTCMSETFSSLGWGVTPDALIAHINFLCQMGINLSVPHYYTYSTGAQAKRDHPASFFFQQPYFVRSKAIFAGTDRTLQLAGRGRSWADTLVIHPIQSVQAILDGAMMDIPGNYLCETPCAYPDCWQQTALFQELSLELMRKHIAFDYGYESVMESNGTVRADGQFQIGHAVYSTVILPALTTISHRLYELLRKGSRSGLRILYLLRRPEMIDGTPLGRRVLPPGRLCESLSKLMAAVPESFPKTLTRGLSPEVALTAREVDGTIEYMLGYYGTAPKAVISSNLPGYVLYNPEKNCYYPLGGTASLHTGRLLHLLPKAVLPADARPAQRELPDAVLLRKNQYGAKLSSWSITPQHDNALMWDAARLPYGFLTRFDDPDYPLQPPGTLSYIPFRLPSSMAGHPVKLCFEPAETPLLKLNGRNLLDLPTTPSPATCSLAAVELKDLLRWNGKRQPCDNILTFGTRTGRPEFFYLTGDFAVEFQSIEQQDGAGSEMPPVPVIASAGTKGLTWGDLSLQGLPFYWGTIRYACTLEESPESRGKTLYLTIRAAAAAAITLVVDGVIVGTLSAAPWQWAIPAALRRGRKCSIELLLDNTAQNFFGPHHPDSQQKHFSAWRPAGNGYFSTASFGIFSAPVLS